MTTSDDYDVIVIGAGVVGPCIATAFARQGRTVLIAERDWEKPNRIVGELLQPSGLNALRQLGMVKAVNNIDATYVDGYYISFHDEVVHIDYPEKDAVKNLDLSPVDHVIVNGDEDKLANDSSIILKDWDKCSHYRGVAFHHGDFLMNLRSICKKEKNVTTLQANVTSFVRDSSEQVVGIRTNENKEYYSKLVVCCDGIYSNFRKELSPKNVPDIGSYFVGLDLVDADLPMPHRGHVILGDHSPVLIYQISKHHTRILCAYRSSKLPQKKQIIEYLTEEVLPNLPKSVRGSFQKALEGNDGNNPEIYRSMPNQYLPAMKNTIPGVIFVGDSLNMRHPLTGGGMTVGLNDAVLITKLLSPANVPDLTDCNKVIAQMSKFHKQRKPLDAVINSLSIVLFALFAADNQALKSLQYGCFHSFLRGGIYQSGPIGLLSGLSPSPALLFYHFFSVAFYACHLNFVKRGIFGFPIALYESIVTLITAVIVFTPYLFYELFY